MAEADRRSSRDLKAGLRKAGLSSGVIDAAWPSWWTTAAEGSPSAQAELRFALARKLGLSAPALMGDRVDFVWKDEARFKHLIRDDQLGQSVLASFAVSVGRLALLGSQDTLLPSLTAAVLRATLLKNHEYVDLRSLLATCWAIGIPVLSLRIFPLDNHKGMHAMAVRSQHRFAILLGRDASYPAPIAFDLAHEIGHIMLGHLANAAALIDDGDRLSSADLDPEETTADAFALELLTGQQRPDIRINIASFGGRQLSRAVRSAGKARRIEPGTLALCAAYQTNNWAAGMAALKHIYDEAKPVWKEVNDVAAREIDWDQTGHDAAEFLQEVMGISNVA